MFWAWSKMIFRPTPSSHLCAWTLSGMKLGQVILPRSSVESILQGVWESIGEDWIA